jgi:multiple sugar transport system substrate-binding protein
MSKFIFSVAQTSEKAFCYLEEKLKQFTEAKYVSVQLQEIQWVDWWVELRRIAFSHGDLSVSEVGSTWAGSLASMNALRLFSEYEVAQLGGIKRFAPASRPSMSLVGDDRIWTIPWQVDVRVIYYWRDMLDAAGIDESTAFETFDALEATLERLQASDVAIPWVMPTARSIHTLLQVVTWMWGMGGDLMAPGETRTRFAESESLKSISTYFKLIRFMPQHERLSDQQANDVFLKRRAAVTTRGAWLLAFLPDPLPDDIAANLGVALLPGPGFVGGSNLVIWNQISPRLTKTALALVAYLTSPEIQCDLSWMKKDMPARLDVLDEPPFSTCSYYRVFQKALEQGRPLQAIPLWGVLEESLLNTFEHIWDCIVTDRNRDIDSIVAENLQIVAQRFDRTLHDQDVTG